MLSKSGYGCDRAVALQNLGHTGVAILCATLCATLFSTQPCTPVSSTHHCRLWFSSILSVLNAINCLPNACQLKCLFASVHSQQTTKSLMSPPACRKLSDHSPKRINRIQRHSLIAAHWDQTGPGLGQQCHVQAMCGPNRLNSRLLSTTLQG